MVQRYEISSDHFLSSFTFSASGCFFLDFEIITGNKEISIKRNIATSKGFLKMMLNGFRK